MSFKEVLATITNYQNESRGNHTCSSVSVILQLLAANTQVVIMKTRANSMLARSQWETALLCNDVSHWLGAILQSTLKKQTRAAITTHEIPNTHICTNAPHKHIVELHTCNMHTRDNPVLYFVNTSRWRQNGCRFPRRRFQIHFCQLKSFDFNSSFPAIFSMV